MTDGPPWIGLEMRSRIDAQGGLTISLSETTIPELAPDEVLIRVEAAPINPSDLGMMFGPADLSTLRGGGTDSRPTLSADVPSGALQSLKARLGTAMAVGNEGAGRVVAAGANVGEWVGRTVAIFGGGLYAQYRRAKASDALVMPDGTLPADAGSAFVNPMTVLSMVETMRQQGHTALAHTAAASNLGQMLVKVCRNEGIGLVNIVRSEAQERLLREIGAVHVCNSEAPDFIETLCRAVAATGATLGFDAVGGGRLAGHMLAAMEAFAADKGQSYSRYGSTVAKQVYIYGGLDRGPTLIDRTFGAAWGVGGWLLTSALATFSPQTVQAMRLRVAREIKTTFSSRYSRVISLREALEPEHVRVYAQRATGLKYLINPWLDC